LTRPTFAGYGADVSERQIDRSPGSTSDQFGEREAGQSSWNPNTFFAVFAIIKLQANAHIHAHDDNKHA
jgi:hypothetical protein